MNFSDSCRCERPAPPCAPACGFLMQQIVGSGRTQLRCERFSLPLCGVPASLCPPLRVLDVCASGPCEEVGRSFCGCGGVELRVRIPLSVTLCDQRGCRFEGCSSIEVPVTVRLGCGAERGAQYVACAHVRLARGGESAPCDCVQAALDVCVQAWAVCCRAMAAPGQCAPECPPPLPLYPRPCRPPRDPWRPR